MFEWNTHIVLPTLLGDAVFLMIIYKGFLYVRMQFTPTILLTQLFFKPATLPSVVSLAML